MLRRVNAALFEAPAGARIQVVAAAQENNGVNDARFEYAGQILPRETIQGLPGCSFTVADAREGLEAAVVFDPAAPGSARYDLFEIENGATLDLHKSTTHSDFSPLISFTIKPEPIDVSKVVAVRPLEFPRPTGRRPAKRKARKRPAPKNAASKRPATTKTTPKKTTRRKAGKKRTRTTLRKRAK